MLSNRAKLYIFERGKYMGTVYIISEFGKLTKKDDALSFYNKDGTERKIFIHRLDRLIILGSVEITSSALKLLMRHQIDTVFLNKNGKLNGKLEFQDGKNVFLRKRQYEILSDQNKMVTLVKAIVRGKIKNQISFMQRIARKTNDFKLEQTIQDAQRNEKRLEDSNSIESIRGYEGYGSKLFFSVFKYNIIPEWAVFNGRTMHPPKDVVNAVMSFLYTLLNYRIDSFIVLEGLDPYVGYLHTLDYGKRALSFDLMEEYRTSICDTLTCALFNLGILKFTDFQYKDFTNNDDDYPLEISEESKLEIETTESIKGVLLTEEGLKKTANAFEEKMTTEIFYPPLGKKISYQNVIIEQIKHYKRVIMDQEAEYKPFVIK